MTTTEGAGTTGTPGASSGATNPDLWSRPPAAGSAGASPLESPTAEAQTPRRRRGNRPPTVPLSEFGKEPPPPPPIRLTPRQIVGGIIATVVTIAVLWVVLVYFGGIGDAKWSQGSRCLDVRVQC